MLEKNKQLNPPKPVILLKVKEKAVGGDSGL
jgi:hypothetical protein